LIALFTDFGSEGPYLGQMEAVLKVNAPSVDVINLVSNAPTGNPRLSAHLLAALYPYLPENTVFLCVVDPGVGGDRLPVILRANGRWFVGPENGLFNGVVEYATDCQWWIIEWRPEELSPSFHGRDLFAPVAATLARGDLPGSSRPYKGPDLSGWPADIASIIYIDGYGNAMTGWRFTTGLQKKILILNGHQHIKQADTFCGVPVGEALWYKNSCGLVEIAVNGGRADEKLDLNIGDGFRFSS